MNIRILHMIEGAKAARGIAVIIDVFRAFTVETYLMRGGAAKIIPVGDVQIAWDYKAAHPDAILCGERQGVIIDGFDYGNSPSALEHADLFATNTEENPDNVKPHTCENSAVEGGILTSRLPKKSWNMVRLGR